MPSSPLKASLAANPNFPARKPPASGPLDPEAPAPWSPATLSLTPWPSAPQHLAPGPLAFGPQAPVPPAPDLQILDHQLLDLLLIDFHLLELQLQNHKLINLQLLNLLPPGGTNDQVFEPVRTATDLVTASCSSNSASSLPNKTIAKLLSFVPTILNIL